MQFIGSYYHALEEKGRISVPKKFRSGLTKGSIITQGLDGCLFIFPESSWQKLTDTLQSLPLARKEARDFLRRLTYNAAFLEFDKLGRTRLPENLLEAANLKKDVVFAGALTRVEMWDKQRYHDYLDSLQTKEGEIESALAELGI